MVAALKCEPRLTPGDRELLADLEEQLELGRTLRATQVRDLENLFQENA